MTTLDFEHKVEVIINSIKEDDDILEKNKELLMEMKRDFVLDGLSPAWQQNVLSRMKIMAIEADFNFDEASKDDIKKLLEKVRRRDISERTFVNYKGSLKRFYRWMNEGEYPEIVDWVNTTFREKNNTLPEDLLLEEDIKELIKNAKTSRDKALISILWETGARIGELIDLEVGDIRDHKHGYQVVLQGKTGSRRIPLISSVPYINSWLNDHPSRDKKNPLWTKIRNSDGEERISYRYIRKMLNATMERSEIDKPSNPHHFRHSRATYLASRLKEAQLCEWFGWVQGSDVPAKYVHMSGRDIDSDYARIHGIEDEENPEESKLAPKECPRCNKQVPPNADYCYQCGKVLNIEEAKKIERQEESVTENFTQLAKDNPELLDNMKDFLEMLKMMEENEEVMRYFKDQLKDED